jgi:DMSO/TMAO reductase YedYZ heme-binding membrane subunit
LALRPLADIFPDLRVLRTLVVLRREFGIFSGLMIVAHFIGFLLSTGTPITAVFTDGQFWTWNNFLFWGLLGLFAAIPALVTSNTFSIIRLKRWWKTVQHLAYLFSSFLAECTCFSSVIIRDFLPFLLSVFLGFSLDLA